PAGPIFHNSKGRPWTRNSLRCRFRTLRKKFPQLAGVVCYTMRHSFATDALERGLTDATVAELMGHAGTQTLHRHYNKLAQKVDHLRAEAAKLSGGPGPSTQGP